MISNIKTSQELKILVLIPAEYILYFRGNSVLCTIDLFGIAGWI
jgi:hypothetical protein